MAKDSGERQESGRLRGPPGAGSSLVDEVQFEPWDQSAVLVVAAVAVVVVVAIEMAVSTILVLAFEEGGNVMLWRASAMVRIYYFPEIIIVKEKRAGGGNHDFLITIFFPTKWRAQAGQ